MKKSTAINILEDIQDSLYCDNWKEQSLIKIIHYIKCIEIAINPKIIKLIEKYGESIKHYGKNDKKSRKLAKKIDNEINKIYNTNIKEFQL